MNDPDTPACRDCVTRAWKLTQQISPRAIVRVPTEMVGGTWTNSYPETHKTAGQAPDSPWAIYLTDEAGRYRFLLFDFDAKKGNAKKDQERLTAIFRAAHIRHVVTTSGPDGGRHVWVACADTPSNGLVIELAQLAASLYQSLDVSPLTNQKHGAARPPFSPHRVPGAISQPDAPIDITPLLTPTTQEQQLRDVAAHLRDMGAELPTAKTDLHLRGVVSTATGRQQLKGRRRNASRTTTDLLNTKPADGEDLSKVAAAILAGLARARYSYEEVARLARTAPGLEHIRSMAHPSGGRTPRSTQGFERTLERKWRYALAFVALSPVVTGDDDDFEDRAAEVTDRVLAAQATADATPGRWQGAGYKDRLVLDALCAAMLAAARHDIEMDVRRLALTTGYGRTQTALALHSLARDGWVERTSAADGVHGSRFALGPRFSTSDTDVNRTQVMTPPANPLQREREAALRLLELRLERASDPLFSAPRALGRTAGRVAAALQETITQTVTEIAHAAGLPLPSARHGLRQLHGHGLTARLTTGWIPQLFEHTLRRCRSLFDVDDWAQQRVDRISVERYVWAWWSAELQWMRAKGKDKRRRRHHSETAVPLLGTMGAITTFPRYPKTPKRRGDHVLARAIAEAGGLTSTGWKAHAA